VTEYGPGLSSQVSIVVVPMTFPDAPSGLAARLGNTIVDLTWTDNFNGGSTVINHVIQFSTNGGTNWQTFTPPAPVTGSSVRVTGLTNGLAYVFRVATTNSVGNSGYSNVAGPVTPVAPAQAPTNLVAIAGNAQADLTWTVPANDGGSSITDYQIQSSTDGGVSWVVVADAVSTATSATLTSLVNGTSYQYRVAAITSYGLGFWSTPSSSVMPMTVPTAPFGLGGVRGDSSVALSWLAPTDNGGVAVTDYKIEYRLTSAATWTTFSDGVSAATSATVTGLTNGSPYEFRVIATNLAGFSPTSNVAGPLVPMTTASAPLNLVGAFGDKKATLSWSAPSSNGGGAISDYSIQYRQAGVLSWITVPHTPSTVPGAVVPGLTNGIEYIFRITAINPVGSGQQATVRVTPMTIPSAPVIVSATPGDSKVTLAWNAPGSDGGGAIANYLVEYKVNSPTAAWVRFPRAASSATSATVQPLINGTSYFFRVSGINAAGTGPASVASEPATPVTTPSAATGLVAVGGDKSATLTWTAPLSNGGSAITGYTVQAFNAAGTDAVEGKTCTPATATGTNCIVTGLTNGTAYTFKVTAANAKGSGAASNLSATATPVAAPAAPGSPLATANTGKKVTISWTAPANNGSPITGYTVTAYTWNGSLETIVTPAKKCTTTSATTCTISALTAGTQYTFKITATNAKGTSTAATTAAVTAKS
jgi:hypothetical protein